jgi:cobalt-zinc-cadmium resistance protein CzcA
VKLVGKTTFTVAENLILGCLIVIFCCGAIARKLAFWFGSLCNSVVFVVSISFMNIFGIDANELSLGAIDFGIIIDGAVLLLNLLLFKLPANPLI